MRIQNSLKNMFFGVIGQSISVLMGFILRTIIIYKLGIEYVGVEGLFTSIFIMLSLANLGFDTAIIYSLYKPLAENDIYRIQALMNLYRKAYRFVGVIILLIGLFLLPFLPYLMNGETTIKNISLIYVLFLINSASSYYFVYKQSIIIANQQFYVISKIHSFIAIVSNSIQIILLLITSSYIILLSTQITFRIVENFYIANKANKLYPFIKLKNDSSLSKNEKKQFFVNLYSLMLYKISGVVINGTDNIVISIFVGIKWVGIYSNYFLIISTLTTFLSYLFYSITASVGNLNVVENSQKKYFIFRVINFSNFWIYGLCTVFLWNLINPFINLWLDEKYVFNKIIVISILMNFYTGGMQNASTTFRETTGLFKKGKYRPVIAAIVNIIASVILVQKIGISGVFIGTVISRLCTYFWYDPYVIFKFVFNRSIKIYYLRYFSFLLLVLISVFITDILGKVFFHSDLVINIFIRGLLSLIIPNIIFFLIYRRSEEFNYLCNIVRLIANKIPSRLSA